MSIHPAGARRPAVAGVELSAGAARVVVARREDARLRVLGRGEAALSPGAVTGGLVADRAGVASALANAFVAAERVQRAERVAVAIDGDDMRTYHSATSFEREESTAPVAVGEVTRAAREAAVVALKAATVAVDEDPALRGVPTGRLSDDVASVSLDGRPLASLVGHRGRIVSVWTDVGVAPLMLSGAAVAALEAAKRRASVVPGTYALGRLLAGSGLTDAGVLRLGADVTALTVLREGRVAATRVFALGRDAVAARADHEDHDARVWADCVVASLRGLEGLPSASWYFVGVPETLLSLPRALADAVGEVRGGAVEVAPLTVGHAGRAFGDVPLRADDLVAIGAAALAAGLYG